MGEGQKLAQQIGPWQVQGSKEIYSNPWIQVREDQVLHPDGQAGIYGVVSFRNLAVGIVPLDNHGDITLVGQHRYPLDYYSWEIPEGGCQIGIEKTEAAALRELREETGLRAARLDYLGCFTLSNSVSDEIAHLYLARDLTPGEHEPESTEILSLQKIPFSEACRRAEEGELNESMTTIALLRARRFLECEAQGLPTPQYRTSP